MKTFLRENSLRLLLLLILTLCMVGLRTVNIHKVWYYFTPWENLGVPPVEAQKIAQVNLPVEGGVPQARVYIKAAPREFYGCCNLTETEGWAPADKPYYKFYGSVDADTVACTERLKFEWGIPSNIQNAKDSKDTGRCYPHKYLVYQLKQDGSVWGKTVYEEVPRQFKEVSFEIVFFAFLGYLVFLAFAWARENHVVLTNDQQVELQTKTIPIRLALTGLVVLALCATIFHYKTNVNQVVKDEFTGGYMRSDGLWVYRIALNADQTFHMEIVPDFGGPLEDDGYYVVDQGNIRLIGSPNNIFANKFDLIPIKWDKRRYLIETALINNFCESVGHSKIRNNAIWIAYLHQDDRKLPAEGEPKFVDGRKVCP